MLETGRGRILVCWTRQWQAMLGRWKAYWSKCEIIAGVFLLLMVMINRAAHTCLNQDGWNWRCRTMYVTLLVQTCCWVYNHVDKNIPPSVPCNQNKGRSKNGFAGTPSTNLPPSQSLCLFPFHHPPPLIHPTPLKDCWHPPY